ncbi:tetraacyldisaccharide 4'-kinase [soil metagenome]
MPFSRLYGSLTDLRNRLYDRGLLRSYSLGAPTISVGNITTGGTGKTPLVAHIALALATRGEKVCILTRGYGRRYASERVVVSDGEKIVSDPSIAGDEPVELALKLSRKAIIIADADRVAAAEWALREYGVTAFILDDGFQHRKAKRDVDIVCVDATDPWGGLKTLPGGRLREPLAGMRRADIAVITRSDLVPDIEDLRAEISNWNPDAAIFAAQNEIVRVTELEDLRSRFQRPDLSDADQPNASPFDVLTVKSNGAKSEIRLVAFCGLGNPENFFMQIRKEDEKNKDFNLCITKSFPDHHSYTQADIDDLEAEARQGAGVCAFVTTAKDAIKLSGIRFSIPCYVVEIDVVLDKPDAFVKLL